MKVEELMIGDIVTVNRSECVADGGLYMTWKQDGKIIMVEEAFVRVQYEVGKDDDWEEVDIKDIEPILITPEVLEKNGFYWGYPVDVEDVASNVFGELPIEMPKKSWVWDEGAGVISITFPNDSDGGEISCENGHCYFSFVFDRIIYVHQLQHALKLCGIAKTIKP